MQAKLLFDYADLPAEKAVALRAIAATLLPLLDELRPKVLQAGQQLRAAKEILKHGDFGSFCREVMKTSERMCQYWISIADIADEIGLDLVEQMPPSSAAALSSAPSEVKSQIVDEIKDGGKCPSVRRIKERIRAATSGKIVAIVGRDDEQVANIASVLMTKLEKQQLDDVADFLIAAKRPAIIALCDKIRGLTVSV